MTVLLDTSFLLAAAFERDQHHAEAAEALRNLKTIRLIAAPVEVETFWMVAARLSYGRVMQLFSLLQTPAFQIISLTSADRQRMLTLMQTYQDNELDFADTAQIAIAERMNISQIYTFDRRDFSIVRPAHIPYFELLP